MLLWGPLSEFGPCCPYLTRPTQPPTSALAPAAPALQTAPPGTPKSPSHATCLWHIQPWSQPKLRPGKGEFASGVVTFWWLPGDPNGKWAVGTAPQKPLPQLAGSSESPAALGGGGCCLHKSCHCGPCVGGSRDRQRSAEPWPGSSLSVSPCSSRKGVPNTGMNAGPSPNFREKHAQHIQNPISSWHPTALKTHEDAFWGFCEVLARTLHRQLQ